ncbi:immune inhibitor A domain-containing protein [Pseudoalteromonas rhizosphaerae]|uniref:immune inhibitor A domain-containing protein n=1 Tax=Pseudoalteromonas rhizosphaerae TaxID=2518973 RepID=UPI00384C42A7
MELLIGDPVKYSQLLCGLTLALLSQQSVAKPQNSSPTDIGVVNKERILYWLDKRGQLDDKIAHDKLLSDYIGRGESMHSRRQLNPQVLTQQRKMAQRLASVSSQLPNSTHNTVKVLAILVDFPDLPHDDNGLAAVDSDMYYSSYSQQHYQQMLFATDGYSGPQQQPLQTAYQYYQQASGESLAFTGQVYGWVTADKDAKSYGARQGGNNDIDAPSLVHEAVEKAVAKFNINLADYDLTDLDDGDGDGITNEPDGIIDHVMIFHSSIGEEAGGGVLGTDAIWSHRFYVYDQNNQPSAVDGSSIRLFGYTINPIDAGIGVVVHEFGHDLGLPDEYDLTGSALGEPVALWSVMSGGSWAGSPRGSQPVMFSPYALEYLQNRYQGNWLNQTTISLDEIDTNQQQILRHSSGVSTELNQLKITLPANLQPFYQAVEGHLQYYSGSGDNVSQSMTYTVNLPASTQPTYLDLSAYYSIETDYDYAQVLVNAQPIASQYTQAVNPFYGDIGPYITGSSSSVNDAQQPNNYLRHRFDLSAYAGQTITLSFNYKTDTYTHYFGLVVDDMTISQGDTFVWQDNAEQSTQAQLDGFSRVGDHIYAKPHNYYLQLRSYLGIDSGLQVEQYSPGLLLWSANEQYTDNNTPEHIGEGFILVVDADQNAIAKGNSSAPASTTIQLRDAAFSLYDQRQGLGDTQLTAITEFNDNNDYSFATQPASGVKVSTFGFNFSIVEQAINNSSIELNLGYTPQSGINVITNDLEASFEIKGMALTPTDSFNWQFGDGQSSDELNPNHKFADYGSYTVGFTRTNEQGQQFQESMTFVLTAPLSISSVDTSIEKGNVTAKVTVSGGQAPYDYAWQLGDGSTAKGQSINYRYEYSGDYTLSVIVTDANGAMQSFATQVSADVLLTTQASYSAKDLLVNFNSDTKGGFNNYTYSWDFGDGSAVSQRANPTHTYNQAGSYTVTLIVTDTSAKGIKNTLPSSKLMVTVQKQVASSGSSGGSIFWLLLLLPLSFRTKRQS